MGQIKDSCLMMLGCFHYPNGKSKEYVELRQTTTDKYGNITTLILIAFVLLVPISKYCLIHGYMPIKKLQILKRINSNLNKLINRDNLTAFQKTKAYIASKIKSLVFSIYYHSNTILQILFWFIILSTLSLSELHKGDLLFLAKRLGRIAADCLPIILFLSLRPSPLPYTLYLTLLPIHKWLSRIMILQAIIHAVLYCGFFHRNNTWFKAIKSKNVYGWVATAGFIIIIITSISNFRNRFYKLFYFQHYTWSWIIVICLQFHIRPYKFTMYTIVNLAILIGQVIYRIKLTKATPTVKDLKVIDVSPNLSLIEFPNNLIKNPAKNPGAHIRLSGYHPSCIVRFFNQLIPNYHPYTLVTLPSDNYQKLIVRRSTFQILNNRKYLICGSYDPHLLFMKSRNRTKNFSIAKLSIDAKRILIVVGGSAISFALPILRTMNYHGVPVKVVWVIKDFRDLLILKYFDWFIHGDDFEIFITGDTEIRHKKSIDYLSRYGTIRRFSFVSQSSNISSSIDLENNENQLLLNKRSDSLNLENENENVEISVNDVEYEQEDECQRLSCSFRSPEIDNEEEDAVDSNDDQHDDHGHTVQEISPNHSFKTFSSLNEPFIPTIDCNSPDYAKYHLQQFNETIKRLNIEHKIYKGRPMLDYKYYNWCINEGFTQCSGPVEDDSNNLICCRDLPRNKVIQKDIDSNKIWVVSAGPKGLVKNVKLWANEYGLKFHEEAFYV